MLLRFSEIFPGLWTNQTFCGALAHPAPPPPTLLSSPDTFRLSRQQYGQFPRRLHKTDYNQQVHCISCRTQCNSNIHCNPPVNKRWLLKNTKESMLTVDNCKSMAQSKFVYWKISCQLFWSSLKFEFLKQINTNK